MAYFYVFIGGGLGAMCRYGVTTMAGMLLGGMFPWGTLIVNLVGSFLMGLVLGALLPLAKSLQLLPVHLVPAAARIAPGISCAGCWFLVSGSLPGVSKSRWTKSRWTKSR